MNIHSNGHCLILKWCYKNYILIMTYRSPKCSITGFKSMVEKILVEINGDVMFFGDINIDFV